MRLVDAARGSRESDPGVGGIDRSGNVEIRYSQHWHRVERHEQRLVEVHDVAMVELSIVERRCDARVLRQCVSMMR